MADIKFTLTADNSNLNKALDDSMKEIRTMGKAVGASANDINKAFSKLGKELVKNVGAEKALNALKQKLKAQSGVVDELKKRYAELDEQMAVLEKNGGKAKDFANIQEYEKLKEELKEAQKQYDQLSAAMEGATKQSNLFSTSVNGQVYEGASVTAVVKQMEEEMRRMRDAGKENTEEFARLNKAASDLKDNMLDTKEAINKMASDTAKLDAVVGGLNVAAGGFSVITGSMEMFGAESDNVAEAQKKLQAAIAITTGLTAIQNNLQKQSSLMQGIMLVQEKARTKANNMLAAAQGKATIAQRLFNAVAKANPYVLLATALVTVVGALAAFALSSSNANKEQKKAAERTKLWAEYVKTLADNQAALNKVEIDAAKHAADMAEAEGKSKREVIALQEKQLALEKQLAETADHTYTTGIVGINFEVHDYVKELEDNRKKLLDLQADLSSAKSALGSKKKVELKDGTVIDQDYIDMLQADVDAMQTYVDMGDAVVEMQRNLEVSAAKLAEAKRQLALADEQANTAAKRTTQDLQTGLMDDKYEQQKKQTKDNYNRRIEDIKTQLANERNLTVEQREQMNQQIILLEKNRGKELQDLNRQRLNEQYQAELDVAEKMRSLVEEQQSLDDDTLENQLANIGREKEARIKELEEQKQAWIKAQGGVLDKDGKYSDTSKLTDSQKAYLAQAEDVIENLYGDFGKKIEDEVFQRYATGLQKALREQERLTKDVAWLQSNGRDTTEVKRQMGESALAYMQSEEQEINPEFERWVESLVNFTSDKLEGMLVGAEAHLAKIEGDKNTTDEELIEARAIIAALQKQLKEAKKDPMKKVNTTKLQQFNKMLGDSAKGFKALGQTGNEAFDNIMNDLGDVAELSQSIIDNIQRLAETTAEEIVVLTDGTVQSVKKSAEAGANAVKTVEKASVILAIIGAVLQIAMKVKSLLEDTGTKRMEEIRKAADDLRVAFADLKREMLLDTTQNNTVFGENAYGKLIQYTNAVNTLTEDLETSRRSVRGLFDNFYEYEHHEASNAGRWALTALTGGMVSSSFGGYSEKTGAYADKYKEVETTLNDVAHAIENYQVSVTDYDNKVQEWWRKTIKGEGEEYKSLQEVLKKQGLSFELVGKDAEETFKNIKAAYEGYIKDSGDVSEPAKKQLEEMIKDYEAYFEAQSSIKDMFSGWFGGMTDALSNAIKKGFDEGVGAGKQDFKDAVNDMVSDMFLQLTIGADMQRIIDQYSDSISKMTDPNDIADEALRAADEMAAKYDTYYEKYQQMQDRLTEAGYGKADAMDGTLSGAIKGASQESIDLLSGYCNAVRIQQVDGLNVMRDQLISLSGIERNTLNTNTILTAIRGDLAMQFASDEVRAAG